MTTPRSRDAAESTAVVHRPWPLPRAPWIMNQVWHDLLFAHWPVAADPVRVTLPPGLVLDTYDGVAWVGVVPFWMSDVRPRLCPPARISPQC